MKRGSVIIVTLSFLILSSCQENNSIIHVPFPGDGKTLLFFSDDSNIQAEGTYYDALLDLKKSFPEEVANLQVLQSNDDKLLYKQFNVKTTPSLIVIHQNEVVTQLEGTMQKEDIIISIEHALGQTEESLN